MGFKFYFLKLKNPTIPQSFNSTAIGLSKAETLSYICSKLMGCDVLFSLQPIENILNLKLTDELT